MSIYWNKSSKKYLHVYLGKELHPRDEMQCHEATKYAHNDQVPLTTSSCPEKNPSSGQQCLSTPTMNLQSEL